MVQPATALHDVKYELHRIRGDLNDIRQFLASRRREREYLALKYRLAAARFETALIRYTRACQKAGFQQDQPRWPKGTEDGGRWSGGAGGGSSQHTTTTSSDLSAIRRKPPVSGLPVHVPHSSPSNVTTPRAPVTITNNAHTGISTVDETTENLRIVLEKVVGGLPEGFGPEYGKAVHNDFADAVKSENLRGIGRGGVEQTHGPDPDARDAPYGSKNSIRTDIVLRNEVGDVIAIYDVKTGSASLGPRRVQELRKKTDASPRIPVIEMHIQRGLSLKARTEYGSYFWVITLRLWNPWVRAISDPKPRKDLCSAADDPDDGPAGGAALQHGPHLWHPDAGAIVSGFCSIGGLALVFISSIDAWSFLRRAEMINGNAIVLNFLIVRNLQSMANVARFGRYL